MSTERIEEKPPTPSSPRSMSVIYDLALRRHDFLDRTYDGLNARAAALIALTSLILANTGLVLGRIEGPTLRWSFGAGIGLLLVILLIQALRAYWIGEVDALPDPDVLYGKQAYVGKSDDEIRDQVFQNLLASWDKNRKVVEKKTTRVRWALLCFAIIIGLLVPMTFFVAFMGGNAR